MKENPKRSQGGMKKCHTQRNENQSDQISYK